ncbi:MAG: D-alanine--D-alanine ligase [bacterium]
MTQKIRVGVLFGGRSAEHEVSLQSAKNVVEAIDRTKYDVVLIGIDKSGRWYLNEESRYLLNSDDPKRIQMQHSDDKLALAPGDTGNLLVEISSRETAKAVDVVFPVLHGPFGEDGTVQGLLKLANIPFVGAGVLGSAVGMDKDVMKRLLRDAGIPNADFVVMAKSNVVEFNFPEIKEQLGLPLFIKPANLGSSVGIHKVDTQESFFAAVEDAFQFDHKIIVEKHIKGREIECSVLGNENPIASRPGEIIPKHEFYSYEAKYIDEQGAALEIPARLPEQVVKEVQELAVKTFQTLCCEGMARVDFFLAENNKLFVNEINTIPGFTRISMYPKLWDVTGISYPDLIDRIIELALQRHRNELRLKTTMDI